MFHSCESYHCIHHDLRKFLRQKSVKNLFKILTCIRIASKTVWTSTQIAARQVDTLIVCDPAIVQKTFAFIDILALDKWISIIARFADAGSLVIFDDALCIDATFGAFWLAALAVSSISILASAPKK